MSRHREELVDKYPKLEAANEQLRKELDEKKEMLKALYAKHQLEKQVLCFSHLFHVQSKVFIQIQRQDLQAALHISSILRY